MLKEILLTLGFLALIEGFIVVFFPRAIGKAMRKLSGKRKLLEAGLIEIIASLVLIAVGFIID